VGGRGLTLQLLLFAVLPLTLLLVIIAFGSLVLHSQAMRELVAEREARAGHAAADAIAGQLRQRGLSIRSLTVLATQLNDAQAALDASSYLAPDFEGGLAILDENGRRLSSSTTSAWWEEQDLESLLAQSRRSGTRFAPLRASTTTNRRGSARTLNVGGRGGRSTRGRRNILDDAFPPAVSPGLAVDPRKTLYRLPATASGPESANIPAWPRRLAGKPASTSLTSKARSTCSPSTPCLLWVGFSFWRSRGNPSTTRCSDEPRRLRWC
jgi:hypothetical protein